MNTNPSKKPENSAPRFFLTSNFSLLTCPARRAFTLIELMVVIGIIALLISIALPAFQGARDQVRATTTHATIRVLETGLESFRADTQLGGNYPPSLGLTGSFTVTSPHTNAQISVYGANLLAWALAGADLLGSPGFRDLNNTDPFAAPYQGLAPWADDTGKASALTGLYFLDNGKPSSRIGPFIDVSKTKFAKQVQVGTDEFEIPAGTKPRTHSLCILDAWDQPILYYRANPSKPAMVSENGSNNTTTGNGIYALADNLAFTGYGAQAGMDFGAGTTHPIAANSSTWGWDSTTNKPIPVGSFPYTVWNPNITATPRPHNSDSYILLSPGKDGRFGTADDVANFEINK